MDHPFSRDLPDNCPPPPSSWSSSSSYRPQSSSYLSRSRHDLSGSRHPLTPPPALPGFPVPVPVPGPFPVCSDPIRKITPLEEKGIHAEYGTIAPREEEIYKRDEKLATVKEYKSPYDKVYTCVQEFRAWRKDGSTRYPLEFYEEPYAVKISKQDWFKLSAELTLEESDRYLRLSYNAFTSTLIIQCMPSPVHQSIGSTIGEKFVVSKANLPEDLQDQTVLTWEEDCKGFESQWFGSCKRPDLAIQVRNARGGYNIKFVLETGLSESYNQLVEDAQLWLGGIDEVSMVVLVKFIEVPEYRCPVVEDQDPKELGIPLDQRAILIEDFALDGEYGPATYKGLRWAGEITEANMETWVRNANGEAVKLGNRKDLLRAAQAKISMGDFLPPGYPPTITLNLDRFRRLLKSKIQQLAAERCRGAVAHYRRRMGEEPGDSLP